MSRKYNELNAREMALDPVEAKAVKILQVFWARKGFNHWWQDIDEPLQDEIFEELKQTLK